MNETWHPEGFAIEEGRLSNSETMAVCFYASLNKIPYRLFNKNIKNIPEGWVPEGSVDYIQSILGYKVKPDYYPEYLSSFTNRNIWDQIKWPKDRVFIKPSDQYKRYTGFITNGTYKGKRRGPHICSEVLSFKNEWRYYICNGEILDAQWYSGDEFKMPKAPYLKFQFPIGIYGAIDFGELHNGDIELVEYNHPFSCGWYGTNHSAYVKWLCEGWRYMLTL